LKKYQELALKPIEKNIGSIQGGQGELNFKFFLTNIETKNDYFLPKQLTVILDDHRTQRILFIFKQ